MIYIFDKTDIINPLYDYIEVYKVLSDGNILCNCYNNSIYDDNGNIDTKGELIANRAVFNINESTDIDFHDGEKECILGMPPTESWLKKTIQSYMNFYNIEYNMSDTKAELLEKINIHNQN